MKKICSTDAGNFPEHSTRDDGRLGRPGQITSAAGLYKLDGEGSGVAAFGEIEDGVKVLHAVVEASDGLLDTIAVQIAPAG